MKTYLVSQICVDEITKCGNDETYMMGAIIRRVKANNKEEAIGKFVVATRDVKAQRRLEIHCKQRRH